MTGHLLDALEEKQVVRAERTMPWVAPPTALLGVAAVAVWATTVQAVSHGQLAPGWAVLLLGLCVYGVFTPMHEAAHGSLFRPAPLNTLVGHLVAPLFGPLASFSAYRFLHLEHHRHTNDQARDPDYWSGLGPAWVLPLRWFTQDVYYAYFYLKHSGSRPLVERLEVSLVSSVQLAALSAAVVSGFGSEVLWFWILPSRFAAGLLSFTFNYLPHLPHAVTARENPYRATNLLRGPRWLLSPLAMLHDYHLIHHLYIGVPFYRYARLWRMLESTLSTRGVPLFDVFRLPWRPHLSSRETPHATDQVWSDELLLEQAGAWLAEERAKFRAAGAPLSSEERAMYEKYFGRELLDQVVVHTVEELTNPPFFAALERAGVPLPLDLPRMAGLTLVDTIVLVAPRLASRGGRRAVLFQELVHVLQCGRLGTEAFVREYLSSWDRGRLSHEEIGLEQVATLMRQRFDAAPECGFSVAQAMEQLLRPSKGASPQLSLGSTNHV